VLVSRTVNDLVAGGGFTFEPAGDMNSRCARSLAFLQR
jgi:hypothetical protein